MKPKEKHKHNWYLATVGTLGRKLGIEWCSRCDKSRDKDGKILVN